MNEFGLSTAEWATIQALLATMNAAGTRDQVRAERLVALARQAAAELGAAEDLMREVTMLAMVHDIGKLGSQLSLLNKTGPLSADERTLLNRHPVVGSEILAGLPPLAHLADKHLTQHERWDGGGYPTGIAGAAIPLSSRIVHACDAFLAMCEDRPYRGALPRSTAVTVVSIAAGTQFCPTVARALVKVLAKPAPAAAAPAAPAAPAATSRPVATSAWAVPIAKATGGPRPPKLEPPALSRALARARSRQNAPHRITFNWPAWMYVIGIAVGLALGCSLAFPLPHTALLCSVHSAGVGDCKFTKIWMPAAERIGLCGLAAAFVLWLLAAIPCRIKRSLSHAPAANEAAGRVTA